MTLKDFESAEETGRQHRSEEDIVCLEEHDVIFTAEFRLYKSKGNKRGEKKIDDALEEYDKVLE